MIKEIAKKIIERTGYTLQNVKVLRHPQRQRPITREDFFNLYFSKVDPASFFFVQVGANDGRNNDPIYAYVTKYGLSGIAIEPQADVFDMLRRNYEGFKNVRCVHGAVAKESGTKVFYTVKESVKKKDNFLRVTGIASFDKDVFKKTVRNKLPPGADVEAYIQETPIETLSFADLVAKYGIERIDMLQLDCEGYDYEILKTFDFGRFSPSLINLESMHFSDTTREECEALLTRHGYASFRTVSDICAYRL